MDNTTYYGNEVFEKSHINTNKHDSEQYVHSVYIHKDELIQPTCSEMELNDYYGE